MIMYLVFYQRTVAQWTFGEMRENISKWCKLKELKLIIVNLSDPGRVSIDLSVYIAWDGSLYIKLD